MAWKPSPFPAFENGCVPLRGGPSVVGCFTESCCPGCDSKGLSELTLGLFLRGFDLQRVIWLFSRWLSSRVWFCFLSTFGGRMVLSSIGEGPLHPSVSFGRDAQGAVREGGHTHPAGQSSRVNPSDQRGTDVPVRSPSPPSLFSYRAYFIVK